jgi:hypothetical protein
MRRKGILAGTAVMVGVEAFVVARRRGSLLAANTVVRCRDGHLFTTLWIPGASVKAVRLGWWRYQRCPVGHHWSLVTPVRVSEMTQEERRIAAGSHDVRLP